MEARLKLLTTFQKYLLSKFDLIFAYKEYIFLLSDGNYVDNYENSTFYHHNSKLLRKTNKIADFENKYWHFNH